MDAYEHLYNAGDINMILDTINEMFDKAHKGMFVVCHGRHHAMFVVDTVETILKSLLYDSRIVELGKIAALLHDIGNIAGRWNHAQKSAVLAKVFFDGSDDLSSEEKDMVIQAIEDHQTGKNLSSAIGAALLFADKADFSRKRFLDYTIGNRHFNNLEIEDMDIFVSGKAIIINAIATEAFCKDIFISEQYNNYSILLKAANYLGCTCQIRINNEEVKWEAPESGIRQNSCLV